MRLEKALDYQMHPRGGGLAPFPDHQVNSVSSTKADIYAWAYSAFEKTLARLGERVCGPPEEFKAWGQNLGNEQVLTTLTSYGAVVLHRQGEIMRTSWIAGSARTMTSPPSWSVQASGSDGCRLRRRRVATT